MLTQLTGGYRSLLFVSPKAVYQCTTNFGHTTRAILNSSNSRYNNIIGMCSYAFFLVPLYCLIKIIALRGACPPCCPCNRGALRGAKSL